MRGLLRRNSNGGQPRSRKGKNGGEHGLQADGTGDGSSSSTCHSASAPLSSTRTSPSFGQRSQANRSQDGGNSRSSVHGPPSPSVVSPESSLSEDGIGQEEGVPESYLAPHEAADLVDMQEPVEADNLRVEKAVVGGESLRGMAPGVSGVEEGGGRSQPSPGAAATMSPDLRVVSEGGGGGKGEEGGEGKEEEAEDGRGAREEEVRAARWWEDRAALSSLLRDIRQGRRPVDGPLLDLLLVMGRRVFDASYRPSAGVLSACRPRFKEGKEGAALPFQGGRCEEAHSSRGGKGIRPGRGQDLSPPPPPQLPPVPLAPSTFPPSPLLPPALSPHLAGLGATNQGGLGWFYHLLHALCRSELGVAPCALHTARLRAHYEAAAFFCRLKGGAHAAGFKLPGPHSPRHGRPLPPLPHLCLSELRRRLATFLASLHCPAYVSRPALDALRKENVCMALRWLESPLAPLEVSVRSVFLPLVEWLCRDVLMAEVLGEEVRIRLELEVERLEMEVAQATSPPLWRTAEALWAVVRGGGGRPGAREGGKEGGREDARGLSPTPPSPPPFPPPSRLAEAAGPHVDDLLQWLRRDKALTRCRQGSSLQELLLALPPALRSELHAQIYDSPADLVRLFTAHAAPLSSLTLPPSPVGCLPMPPSSPPRRPPRGLPSAPSSLPPSSLFRECHRLAPSLSQVLMDLNREEGVEVAGEVVKEGGGEGVQQAVREVLGRRTGGRVSRGLEAAVQRVLFAASRTVFGGDVFFVVQDLFGGEGVILAPVGKLGGRGAPGIGIEVAGGWGEGGGEGGAEGGKESPCAPPALPLSAPPLSVRVTSQTSLGLFLEEGAFASPNEGCGHHTSSQPRSPSTPPTGPSSTLVSPPPPSLPSSTPPSPLARGPRPMLVIHAILTETLSVSVAGAGGTLQGKAMGVEDGVGEEEEAEVRVHTRGRGAGRTLSLRVERPPTPFPSPGPSPRLEQEGCASLRDEGGASVERDEMSV